jgi:hypothetical protein
MRKLLVLSVGVPVLLGGCTPGEGWNPFARPEPVPAVFTIPEAEVGWLLIAPPDHASARIIRESVRHLPGGNDDLPRAGDAYPSEHWEASRALFRQIASQPSARARAELLAGSAYDRAAPRTEWRQVREFKGRERCETTLDELREVTAEYTSGITYRPGMPLEDLQFLFLFENYAVAECVPITVAMRIETE